MAYIGYKPADKVLTASDITDGIITKAKLADDYDDKIQSNIALLGFKAAVNGSLAKYNLQDQIIDEYADASGIDTSASTDEDLDSGAYHGRGGVTTPTVTGGSTAVDGDYTVHTFTANGNFITDTAMTVDYLIVGGGGGGGSSGAPQDGGGGGGGGVISATSQSLAIGTFAAVIGAGGAATANGVASSFNSQTAGYGGAGGNDHEAGSAGGATDGSGGGAGTRNYGNSAADGNGNAGGDAGSDAGGGGGGRGSVGQDGSGSSYGGDGGDGLSNSITGSAVYYGAGGGGGLQGASYGEGGSSNRGGRGGNNSSNAVAGVANSGSGGGGNGDPSHATGGAGGSGVVIIRYLTIQSAGADLTLQSTDTTASTANPDYADMVCLIENAEGTATLNTDIKGYISEDSGVTFTQGTFVDEGSWGTDKKIIAFHDLDISAQSGSSMCYKITTHNQSNGSKETKIHATSIGWKA